MGKLLSAARTALVAGALAAALGACGTPRAQQSPVAQHAATEPMGPRLSALGRPDVLMLGEQHDATEHHRQHRLAVQTLAQAGELAAVVLEMADAGHTTQGLPTQATEAQVQQALAWRNSAWPWAHYGPAVMAAVAAGVPVHGGNLPRQRNTATMKEPDWDQRVAPAVLEHQRQAVREGHCNLLPPAQIAPMTRIQVARDAQLAQTLVSVLMPGKTVLLLTGSHHAHRRWGVPQHLPTHVSVKSVRLAAGGLRDDDPTGFDAVWTTPPVPPQDHCAALKGTAMPQ